MCLSQRMRDANLPWTDPTHADLTVILKSVIAAHTSDADNGAAALVFSNPRSSGRRSFDIN
jgi:hypothetical protein